MKKKNIYIFIIACTLLCAVPFINICLPLYKIGLIITTDSASYLMGAKNILSRHGFSGGYGNTVNPIIHWPPLFSTYLAFVLSLGFKWYQAFGFICFSNYFILTALLIYLGIKLDQKIVSLILFVVFVLYHPVFIDRSLACLSESTSWICLLVFEIILFKIMLSQKRELKLYLVLGLVLGLNYLTRYASIAIYPTIFAYFGLDYFTKRKYNIKGVISAIIISSSVVVIWVLRNLYVSHKLADGSSPDHRFFRNAYYSISNYWEVFLNIKNIEGYFPGLLILFFIPFFIYRFIKSSKEESTISQLISFNYLLILFYTGAIILIRTFSDHVTVDSRMFSVLIIPFAIILFDIRQFYLHFAITSIIILTGLFRWNDLFTRDTGYSKIILKSESYAKIFPLHDKKIIKTNDPTPFMMINNEIEYSKDVNLKPNELFVMFFDGYHFDKKLYDEAINNKKLKREEYQDGVIFYPE